MDIFFFAKDMLFISLKRHHIHINSMFLVVFTFSSDDLRHHIDDGAEGQNAVELKAACGRGMAPHLA
jgi:hypothetical protein